MRKPIIAIISRSSYNTRPGFMKPGEVVWIVRRPRDFETVLWGEVTTAA